MNATVGSRVLYKLTEQDAASINVRRADYRAFEAGHKHPHEPGTPRATGHIAHFGNEAAEGDVYPADVVRKFHPDTTTANLQVHLDGNDHYWATSRVEGDEPGQWSQAETPAGATVPRKPQVNDHVLYVSHGTPPGPDGSQAFPSVPRAAIITEVSEQNTSSEDVLTPLVSLCVLNPTGMFFTQSVPYHEGDTGEGDAGDRSYRGGSWHWDERAEG